MTDAIAEVSIWLTVNGRATRATIPPRLSLADFLRERLDLTGTHLGCEHGACGACTVLVDDEPIRSCLSLAVANDGREVVTIEGLAGPEVAALRAGLVQEHGVQCGFCTPGMLVTCVDIVRRGRAHTEDEVRHELSGNMCRCTGYVGIVRAVVSASQQVGS